MNTTDTLTLKALQLKSTATNSGNGQITDYLIRSNPEMKAQLRNICAFISPELFTKVENACKFLEITKREMIEMALIDIMEKIHLIIERHEVMEAFEESTQPKEA